MAESATEPSLMTATTQDADELVGTDVSIWRYPDMCKHWNVSRATIERWVRQYDDTGVGIPVHRDPSGRPYWLAHEASGMPEEPHLARTRNVGDDRLAQLRRAAKRRSGRPGRPR